MHSFKDILLTIRTVHCTGHVHEMSSFLCPGKVKEIVPYTVSENVKEMLEISKCTWHVNYPRDFQGFLLAGKLTFLPCSASYYHHLQFI